jgi:excisionase family DNA binding protein
MTQKLLDVKEIALILNISKSYVYELIRRGQLPVVRFGRAVRVPERAVYRYILPGELRAMETSRHRQQA